MRFARSANFFLGGSRWSSVFSVWNLPCCLTNNPTPPTINRTAAAAAAAPARHTAAGNAPGPAPARETPDAGSPARYKADLLDMLVRIGRNDPAARRALHRQRVGQPFHLHRILDRHLLLGRQRQRRPMARVLQRPLAVGVERDLHLDHAVVFRRRVRRPAASPSSTFGSSVSVYSFARLAAGADEAVRRAGRHISPPAAPPPRHRSAPAAPAGRRSSPSRCGSTGPRTSRGPRTIACGSAGHASRRRAKRSLVSGHAMPVDGTSFSHSPVPMPSMTRPGNIAPSVPNACATTEGW